MAAEHHPLRRYRDGRNLTQEALAKELGVTPVTVSRWETGTRKVDLPLVPKVAEVTGIPPRELRPDLVEALGAAE